MDLTSADAAIVRRTQAVDLARSIPLGVLLPLETSVLLTIAIKRFDASGLVKGLVSIAAGVGMLTAPLVTSLARRSARPVMVVAAALAALGTVGFLVGAIGPVPLFVVGGIVGTAAVYAVVPLMTSTYERNYPATQRGRRVGWAMTVKVAVTAVAGIGFGALLRADLGRWRLVLLAGAGASVAMVLLVPQVPSLALPRVPGVLNRPWPHFHLLGEDRRLRLTLGAWMLMGFGNLMLQPLRVEYLARPRYGISANPAKITLITVTVPAVVRLLSMPVFGVMFDRLSFFASRIMVNLLFAMYVAAFFTGTSDVGLVAGATVLGVASAGGDLSWNLWVTKFAPAGRVADYMGLHTFFTGIRAATAPLLAFAVVARFSLGSVAAVAAVLMVASSLVLVPEARAELAQRELARAE